MKKYICCDGELTAQTEDEEARKRANTPQE